MRVSESAFCAAWAALGSWLLLATLYKLQHIHALVSDNEMSLDFSHMAGACGSINENATSCSDFIMRIAGHANAADVGWLVPLQRCCAARLRALCTTTLSVWFPGSTLSGAWGSVVVPHDAFEETNEKRIGRGRRGSPQDTCLKRISAPSRRADRFGVCKFGGGGDARSRCRSSQGGALFWLEHGFGGVDCAMATPPAHEVVLLVNGTPAECCIADGHSPCAKAAGNPQELGDPPWADGTMAADAVTRVCVRLLYGG